MNMKQSLRDNLSYKTLIEYPVLHVVLRDHWEDYPLKEPGKRSAPVMQYTHIKILPTNLSWNWCIFLFLKPFKQPIASRLYRFDCAMFALQKARSVKTPAYSPQNTDFPPRPIIPAALYHVPAQRLLVLLFFTMVTSYQNGDGGVLLSVTVAELTSAVTVSKKRIRQSSPLTSWIVKWQVTRRDECLFFFSSPSCRSCSVLDAVCQ